MVPCVITIDSKGGQPLNGVELWGVKRIQTGNWGFSSYRFGIGDFLGKIVYYGLDIQDQVYTN